MTSRPSDYVKWMGISLHLKVAKEAAEEAAARAAEEADALEEMDRLRSEVIGDAQLEQPALQLALRIGAKTGDVALATTASSELSASPTRTRSQAASVKRSFGGPAEFKSSFDFRPRFLLHMNMSVSAAKSLLL